MKSWRRVLVGTRGSRLALAQTEMVIELLQKVDGGVEFVPVPMKTMGDSRLPGKDGGVDGKTAFTGEIDRALLEGRVDISVHSMKDLPLVVDKAVVVATPLRGDPRDALVSIGGGRLDSLKEGARIGTSSVRRKAQLLARRGDVEVVELHGNVETRLRKLVEEKLDGVVLAAAGLQRLGLGWRISQSFEPEEMVPAVCQGTVAVEARKEDAEVIGLLRRIDDPRTRAASECERAFSEELGGDCDVPLGAFAEIRDRALTVVGVVSDPEGKSPVRGTAEGTADDPRGVGKMLASKLMDSGGRRILEEIGG